MEMIAAMVAGFALDLALGDPPWLPHPVAAIGAGVAVLEKALRRLFPKGPGGETAAGAVLAVLVAASAFWAGRGALWLAGCVHPAARLAAEGVMCFQALAARGLRDASAAVYRELAGGNLAGARLAVGRIVGRDTARLAAPAVARAAVETVAENTSDGIVAPLLYFAVGGAPLAWAYKAINTMDSMVGYRNARYLHFGRVAARLDDAANFIPARVTALLLIAAALACGMDWRGAWRIYRRDRNNHPSPNSAHPEAAVAGALRLRLGGSSRYGGRLVEKPGIGDAERPIASEDIGRANRLSGASAFFALALCGAARLAAAAAARAH